jgi:HK97 family phage major capsid protein
MDGWAQAQGKSMSKALELRKQRDAKIQEMHDLTVKTAFAEEQQTRWNTLDKEQEALRVQIESIEKSDALSAEMRKHNPPPAGQVGENRADNSAKEEELRKKAFDTYIRRGQAAVEQNPELRTYAGLDTGLTGDAAGYTVPIGFQRELEVKLKAFGGMLGVCRIVPTAIGNTINWPTMDDTTNSGEWLAEAAPVSQLNPTFGQKQLGSNLLSSKQVLISVQLLNDSAFDVESELKDAFAIRLGRAANLAYTSGDGSGKPNGILHELGSDNDVTAVGDSQSGQTALNSIGIDDLDNVQMAVNAAYRQNGVYMFSDNTLSLLKKLKDGFGRPLWISSLTQAQPDTIYGKKYVVNYDMPSLPATASPDTKVQSVIFGDFSKYIIRTVGGVSVVRYNELYMPNHQVGFQAYQRADGKLIQPAAFAVLAHD